MSRYIQVQTTVSSKDEGHKIGEILLNKKIAASYHIMGPITSTYWWEKKIKKVDEFLCLIKTSGHFYNKVEEVIKKNHSYPNPEIIALPIKNGLLEYLNWIEKIIEIKKKRK